MMAVKLLNLSKSKIHASETVGMTQAGWWIIERPYRCGDRGPGGLCSTQPERQNDRLNSDI